MCISNLKSTFEQNQLLRKNWPQQQKKKVGQINFFLSKVKTFYLNISATTEKMTTTTEEESKSWNKMCISNLKSTFKNQLLRKNWPQQQKKKVGQINFLLSKVKTFYWNISATTEEMTTTTEEKSKSWN